VGGDVSKAPEANGIIDAAIAQTPLGRIGQPGDIASIAVFLASEDSAWLTGEQLLATGGLR
jgi:3-oxoacyl-[acyl-carrier protein] reductase